MIDEKELVRGKHFFNFAFCDPKPTYPLIETLVYVGKNLYDEDREDGEDKYYFQFPKSYFKYGCFLDSSSFSSEEKLKYFDGEIVVAGDHCLHSLCNIEELIEKLEKFRRSPHTYFNV